MKKKLSRSEIPRMHRRYNRIWFTYHGELPILVCDIIHIVQSLNVRAMYDHRFLEDVIVTGRSGIYTKIEIWNGS